MSSLRDKFSFAWKPAIVVAALVFLYSLVLWKLGYDWWTDDNYSHGLLVPLVIAFVLWNKRDELAASVGRPEPLVGLSLITSAALMLLFGTLAAILFAQRVSLVLMIAGILIYFFGRQIIRRLTVPFVLLLLAVPIPQILFNKIVFPLQLLASKFADRAISLLGIPVERQGNVIDVLPYASDHPVSLEVVEACSGIRSLMTLITLALILGYFTRERRNPKHFGPAALFTDPDVQRTCILMLAAIPVALLTNAGRVVGTGLIAYYYGQEGVEGRWHDVSGSIVFFVALALLIGSNLILKRYLAAPKPEMAYFRRIVQRPSKHGLPLRPTLVLVAAVVCCGVFVNWFQYRGEILAERRPLAEMPRRIGGWEQRNDDIRFDEETEKVLRATDYVMRDYYGPGKRLNLYIGYYGSQRSGATYHSPLSCLPGTGWEMERPETLDVVTPTGRRLTVNKYLVSQGSHQEYLIYWYQGRGRTFASEYKEKVFVSLDSLTRRRSDGGVVRIMTPLGKDPARSLEAAIDLASRVADVLPEFLPD